MNFAICIFTLILLVLAGCYTYQRYDPEVEVIYDNKWEIHLGINEWNKLDDQRHNTNFKQNLESPIWVIVVRYFSERSVINEVRIIADTTWIQYLDYPGIVILDDFPLGYKSGGVVYSDSMTTRGIGPFSLPKPEPDTISIKMVIHIYDLKSDTLIETVNIDTKATHYKKRRSKLMM